MKEGLNNEQVKRKQRKDIAHRRGCGNNSGRDYENEKTVAIRSYNSDTCHSLNVRKEPSTDSEILRIIHKDMEVKILKDANETWYKVRIPEIKTGFCMKEFIKVNK